jgi:predicted ATPase
MLANFILSDQRSQETVRFELDQRVAARAYFARVLWFQGFADEAMGTARDAVAEAREINHVVSLSYALAIGACPVVLWAGDLAAAERYIAMLLDHSARHALPSWAALERIFKAVLLTRRGPGLRQLRADFDELGARPDWITTNFLNELALGFAHAGQVADGLAAVEQAIERAERTGARWMFPESLRIKGELFVRRADTEAAAAEDLFRQALDWARRQGALSLELRAATSLGRSLRDQGRPADAMAVLRPVYDRFTEGFDTLDLARLIHQCDRRHNGLATRWVSDAVVGCWLNRAFGQEGVSGVGGCAGRG